MSDPARRAPEPAPRETARPGPTKPDGLDGFRVEVDAARERVDIILDRPPLNVVTMNQRDQLRVAFEAADADSRVRVIVLRASGEHFSSGGEIQGFLDASPEHVSQLAWNIAAPARCKKPVKRLWLSSLTRKAIQEGFQRLRDGEEMQNAVG